MNHPDYAEEKQRLDGILGYLRVYETAIVQQKKEIDVSVTYSLEHYNDDNAEQFNELSINLNRQEFLLQKTRDVSKALLKPYFARVDFAEEGKDGVKKMYIGKMTLFAKDGAEMLIVDWRAPVSTLYYEGRIGEASYDCPDGTIYGEISLKRQYMIENGELTDVTDIDITTNDEFLQAALGASRDNRLHDIVTTIQAEQNRIIRAEMFSPLIVQGAAGGGKTTIALHRVAYLLYAYEKNVKAKNIMIIAPSRFFLSYISGVLPDLGVENIVQTTFEDFAQWVIGAKLRVRPAVQALAGLIESGAFNGVSTSAATGAAAARNTETPLGGASTSAATGAAAHSTAEWLVAVRVKSSYEFYDVLERYYQWMEKTALPKEGFIVDLYEIIPLDGIAKLFFTDHAYLPLSVRVREIKKVLASTLRREKKRIVEELHVFYGERHRAIVKGMPDGTVRRQKIIALLAERDALIERFLNRCKTAVAGYLKKFVVHPALTYYTALISNPKLFDYAARGILTPEERAATARCTLSALNGGLAESEDLAPLMYLHFKAHGLEDPLEIKHIVIDEAQDLSVMQFRVLRLILGTGSFSILGDLHQGIYSYKSIKSWHEIIKTRKPAASAPSGNTEMPAASGPSGNTGMSAASGSSGNTGMSAASGSAGSPSDSVPGRGPASARGASGSARNIGMPAASGSSGNIEMSAASGSAGSPSDSVPGRGPASARAASGSAGNTGIPAASGSAGSPSDSVPGRGPASARGAGGVFERPRVMTLEQSYRTTVEIMRTANIVIEKLALPGVPLAKPVIRHGSPVEIHEKDSLEAISSAIKIKLDEFSALGYRSIAIICKTAAEAKRLKKLLPAGIQLVTGNETNFEQGVKLFPSYLVKGLEFDAVCVANASREQYCSELDVKLLYISMTRALHALVIYSHGAPTDFLP